MIQAFSTPDLPIRYYGIPAIMNPLPNRMLAISYDDNPEPAWVSLDEAEQEYGKNLFIRTGKPSSPNASSRQNLTNQDKREMARRELYINALKAAKTTPGCGGVELRKAVIEAVHNEHGTKLISASTLGEWFRVSEEHEDKVLATLPKKLRNRESTFSEEVQHIAQNVITREYLKLSEPSIISVHKKLIKEIKKQLGPDAEYPSYGTFRNWIKKLNPYLVVSKRSGKQAEREMKRKIIKQLKTERILERVEVDAVNLNVGIIDDHDNYLGTVTIFVCVDCFSRAVLGFCAQVGRGEPSSSVIDSIKHAISPKEGKYLEQCINDYPMYGLMEKLTRDGGTGYTSINTTSWCMRYGITCQTVETKSGWKKPYVESFFVPLREKFAKELPGYVGKRKQGVTLDYSIKEQAVMTLDDFKLQLTRFIVDEYHQVKHSGLHDKSPMEAWSESAKKRAPIVPEDLSELNWSEGESAMRKIGGHKGVRINNIFYNDDEGRLLNIYNVLKHAQSRKPEVLCEYSVNDISKITVLDPTQDEAFEVKAVNDEISSGMTLAEHAALYPAKSQKKKDIDTRQFSDDNKELEKLNTKHANKCKKKQSRSLRADNLDEINEQTWEDKLKAEQAKSAKEALDQSSKPIEDDDEDFNDDDLKGAFPHA